MTGGYTLRATCGLCGSCHIVRVGRSSPRQFEIKLEVKLAVLTTGMGISAVVRTLRLSGMMHEEGALWAIHHGARSDCIGLDVPLQHEKNKGPSLPG
jgi:hypothetical protein